MRMPGMGAGKMRVRTARSGVLVKRSHRRVRRVVRMVMAMRASFLWGGILLVGHTCPFPNADGAIRETLHGFFSAVAVETRTLRAITAKRDQFTAKPGAGPMQRNHRRIGGHPQ
jgi:hypothetical protein